MAFIAALRVLAASVIAYSPSPSPTPTVPPEIAHVVTSDRSDETVKNSVRTIYVVTAADIAKNGYRTVTDALASVPAVEIANYGPIGAAAQYGIRGSSSAQVLVLIDGQPAPGGLADSVELSNISTVGVQRIEVVEGGGSTIYGTGAVGGIINIITNTQKVLPNATLRYGTFDDRELQLSGEGFSFDRTVSNNAFGLPPSETGGIANPQTRNNSDYEATTARYGLEHPIGAIDTSLHLTAESDDVGASGEFPAFSPTSREHDVNEDAALNLALHRAHATTTLSLDASTQQITFACDKATDANCFQLSQSLDTEVRTGVSLRDVVSGEAERTIYGIDLSRGIVRVNDGNGDPVAEDALAQSAAYVQQTWTGAHDEVYAGVRGERDGSLGGEFSPSIGFRYNLSDAIYLKANAATAFRAPNASELYFPNFGNPNLQPERSKVGDVTLTDDRLLGGVSLGWFDNYTHELIVLDPNNNFLPENIDRAHISGFTLDGKTLPLNGIAVTFNATDLYLAQDLDAQSRLPDDPVFTMNLGLQYTNGPAAFLSAFGVSERVVGARGSVDYSQPLFYQPAPYDDLRAYASFRVAPLMLLTVRGFNLGNERYAEVSGYPMPGRTLSVELRTALK
jgi:vitamin B12 transporter